jgi:phage shock protein A
MGNQIPGGPAVPHRDGWPGHGRRPWQTKPVSDAPRWLLGQIGFWIALPGLDAAYHRQRLTQSRVRRAVAAVATSRKQLELQIGQLEQHVGGVGVQSRAGMETGQGGIADEGQVSGDTTGQRLASLRQRHAEMQAKEERLNIASRRLMAEVNAFQVAREAIETAYTAAEEAAQAAWAEVTGNADADAQGAGPASEDQN